MISRPRTNPRTLLQYQRWHPSRPVDWRWRRAVGLVRQDKWPIAGSDDPWTIEAYRYAAARRSLFGKHYFTDRMIDIHAARKIWRADSLNRWELEARILARENINSVAEKTGIAVSTIEAFAAAFFHCWSKIDARDYVHSVVIGSRRPWTPDRVRDLWCYFGYVNGSAVLDAIIRHYRQSGQADYSALMQPLGPKPEQSDLDRSIVRILRLMLLPTDQHNISVLYKTLADLAAAEQELAQPLADDTFAANLDRAVDEALAIVPVQEEHTEAALASSGAA